MIKFLHYFLPVLSGILLSLPWISREAGWVLLIAFVPLLFADHELTTSSYKPKSRYFSNALITFLIWNFLSCWWISYVSFTGMILIVILNALMMSGIWWSVKMIHLKFRESTGYFSLIVFWIAFEFLQHHWEIPWPWLTLGNGFANSVRFIQWYEFTGVLGGSFWVLISNILFFESIKYLIAGQFLKSAKVGLSVIFVIGLPLLCSLWLFSIEVQKGENLNVLILQPNVDPYHEKFSGMSSDDQINRIVTLAELNITDSTDLIIAPETALSNIWEDSLANGDSLLHPVSGFMLKYPNASFISGALTQRRLADGETVSETARLSAHENFYYDIYNSALLFDPIEGVKVSRKSILVNGVERMPFQKYFSFLEHFSINLGGTSGSLAAAESPKILTGRAGLQIGSIICFESAFGEFTSQMVLQGADLLVVLTNDGWWKESSGVWQHFGYARLRAIECRKWIAHSANTGISGFINTRGEIVKVADMNKVDVVSTKVELNRTATFYVRYGDYCGRICVALSILVLIYLLINHWSNKR
jgi:apolipoprotein N-acyltransferase